jgi:putative transposase
MSPKKSKTDVSFYKEKLVEIIAYCIMPTHLHLVLKQLEDNGISIFMNRILNSYSHYFNIKHERKGPLWEGRFKHILVEKDEYLLHLTRYIHLNPVTAYLVNKPEEWFASSYGEYLQDVKKDDKICKYSEILEIEPKSYREFIEDRISYQRELAKIKHLVMD